MVIVMDKSLKEKLNKAGYQSPENTTKDVINALNTYRGLTFSVESFVFSNGTRKELLNLKGTVPVPYKGMNYNIPVKIWIMDTHPNNAPICYVNPTSDMVVKPSRTTDHSGKIYLPFLHFWDPRGSELLLSLIKNMIAAFSTEPPVYAKPKESAQQQQQANQQQATSSSFTPYPTQPYMPMPGGISNPMYKNVPSPAPYPSATPYSGGFPTPYPNYNSGSGSGSAYPPYPTGNSQLPYPPYPSYPGGPPVPSTGNTHSSGTGLSTGTITEEHIKASLLSAVEDKMRRSLREQSSRARDELEILRQTEKELRNGKSRLDDILERLMREQADLDKNISMLKDKEQELSKATERLSDEDPVDVDEAVTTTAPLYKQILNSYAEEAALEDAIYYVGEALRRGVIDLDVFLKQVRSLSRRQFMLRALMQKCRQKAGLK